MSHEPQPTMQSIADRAGVSVMTVSRALKNSRDISDATRDRIREIAQEIGYRPNPLVSALMAQLGGTRARKHTAIIAYVSVCRRDTPWRIYPSLRCFYSGAEERARELGFELQDFSLEEGDAVERASNVLRARGIRAVIIAPLPAGHPPLSLQWNHFSAVTIGYTQKMPALHRVCIDNLGIIGLSLERLEQMGYERIGLALTHEQNSRVGNQWLAGFCQYQYFQKPSQRVGVLLCDIFNEETFINWVLREKPQVIISHTLPEMEKWLRKIGLEVPHDIGLSDIHLMKPGIFPYSGIDQHSEKVGASAVDLVVGMINNNECGVPNDPKVVMLKGDWYAGKTLARQEPSKAKSAPPGKKSAVRKRKSK